VPGGDAYATSKQCTLATAFVFARQTPRLRFNAFEPGFNPSTGLGRDANLLLRLIAKGILPLFAPFVKYWSTPGCAARVCTKILTATSGETGVYYDENGHPMQASAQVRDPKFAERGRRDTYLSCYRTNVASLIDGRVRSVARKCSQASQFSTLRPRMRLNSSVLAVTIVAPVA
jgi:hypothetical protein